MLAAGLLAVLRDERTLQCPLLADPSRSRTEVRHSLASQGLSPHKPCWGRTAGKGMTAARARGLSSAGLCLGKCLSHGPNLLICLSAPRTLVRMSASGAGNRVDSVPWPLTRLPSFPATCKVTALTGAHGVPHSQVPPIFPVPLTVYALPVRWWARAAMLITTRGLGGHDPGAGRSVSGEVSLPGSRTATSAHGLTWPLLCVRSERTPGVCSSSSKDPCRSGPTPDDLHLT